MSAYLLQRDDEHPQPRLHPTEPARAQKDTTKTGSSAHCSVVQRGFLPSAVVIGASGDNVDLVVETEKESARSMAIWAGCPVQLYTTKRTCTKRGLR
jgi:hypothetical protein